MIRTGIRRLVGSRTRVAAHAVLLATLAGCASAPTGKFVWLDDLPQAAIGAPGETYLIGPYDVVSFTAFNHPEVSGRGGVRTDGNITVPLLGDVLAAGKTPTALAQEIEKQLGAKNLVVGARVTVVLDQVAPIRVSILGEVKAPGLYTLEAGSGLAEALATSGGFSEFAHRDQLYIIRRVPELIRIRFKYSDLTSATGNALTFRLKAGDTMLVQ
jgi:polysaccharide biosynthesis/export protein